MKLVVITGCLGLIGSYITRKCLELGWKVYGIDSMTYAANENFLQEFLENKNFLFIKEDISKINYLPDCDYVINVAAESHVGNSIIDSTNFINTNVLGVQNILNLIKNKPSNVAEKPILLHFSTDEVYGDILSGSHTEEHLLKPSNPYSASKAAADMLVLAWSRTYGINYVIVRPTNNYGIGQYPEKLIPLSVKLLQRGKKIKLHNKGTPVRNWLHSDDTAEAVIAIIQSGVKNEIFNISGNYEQTNKETVYQIIENYFDSKVNPEDYIDYSYVREGQDVRYSLDDKKLQSLGWKPKKIFTQEISNIVKYYKNTFKW
jgi:dTDP-glucose 4,6-dehydratase